MPSNGFMSVKGCDAMNGPSLMFCPVSLPTGTVSTLIFITLWGSLSYHPISISVTCYLCYLLFLNQLYWLRVLHPEDWLSMGHWLGPPIAKLKKQLPTKHTAFFYAFVMSQAFLGFCPHMQTLKCLVSWLFQRMGVCRQLRAGCLRCCCF